MAETHAKAIVEGRCSYRMAARLNWWESSPGAWVADGVDILGCTLGYRRMCRGLRIIWTTRACVVNDNNKIIFISLKLITSGFGTKSSR